MTRHLLDIDDLGGRDGIEEILELTDSFVEVSRRPIPKVPALRGKTIAWLFYEDSTRTRLSFEVAAKRLSADTLNFSVGSSSVNKGESLRDTARVIESVGADAIVVRHRSSGAPRRVAEWTGIPVVNAGDGAHAHPTQALLDCYTLRDRFGDLAGRHIAIIGDIAHSRVARSNVAAFTTLGARVTLVGPPTLMPASLAGWPVEHTADLDGILGDLDVVYLLRMQRERIGEPLFPTTREYTARWGLTAARAGRLRADAAIMHPLPVNRGVEMASDVADDPRSLVFDQVRNGVAVRMAVLYLMLGSARGVDPAIGEPLASTDTEEGSAHG